MLAVKSVKAITNVFVIIHELEELHEISISSEALSEATDTNARDVPYPTTDVFRFVRDMSGQPRTCALTTEASGASGSPRGSGCLWRSL